MSEEENPPQIPELAESDELVEDEELNLAAELTAVVGMELRRELFFWLLLLFSFIH